MPRQYSGQVKLFALEKRREGCTWEEVRKLLRERFDLKWIPSRRVMTKWMTGTSVPDQLIENVGHGLPEYVGEMLGQHKDALTRIVTESMTGKDFNILVLKWMFSQMAGYYSVEKLKAAWQEFEEEALSPEKHKVAVTERQEGQNEPTK